MPDLPPPDRPVVALALRPQLLPDLAPPEVLDRLSVAARVRADRIVTSWDGADDVLAEAEVLLTSWGAPRIDSAVLARAPHLRAVVHAAGTVKKLLGPEVWERGVAVGSAAAANARPVAEFTVASMVLARKRAFALADRYRRGVRPGQVDGEDSGMNGVTVGVVGASRIGRIVLRLLAGWDVRLLVSDPLLDSAQAHALGAELVELDKLCESSDVVSVHAPALPETHHLLDNRRLGLMRDGAVLVNTARGALVDTDALARHCATGRLDAVLDVTDPEPLPAGHPLYELPNVLVTPHLAGARGNEVRRLGAYAVDDILRFLRGEPMLGAVTIADLRWTA